MKGISIFRIILAIVIFMIVDTFVLIYWHKKIDSETTWIYGIYVMIQTILCLSLVIGLECSYSIH